MCDKEEYLKKRFYSMLEGVPSVDFKEEWNNGTGYYNGVVKEEGLPKVFKFCSPAPNNRTGVVFCINGMRVCIFERFTPNSGSPFVLVSNDSPIGTEKISRSPESMFVRVLFRDRIEERVLIAVGELIRGELEND